MFKKRIREGIANNDTSTIIAEFKGVEKSISGNIHGDVPRYIVYLGDADIVRYMLEQIAIHECAIGIEDNMATTVIACIAGAVQRRLRHLRDGHPRRHGTEHRHMRLGYDLFRRRIPQREAGRCDPPALQRDRHADPAAALLPAGVHLPLPVR